MSRKLWPQPLIVVRDVERSGRFYAAVLGGESAHEGSEYGQILEAGELVLQLHSFDADHHHGPLVDASSPIGNGILLWFETADFDAAVERIRAVGAAIVRDVEINPNAEQPEIWFRDPDGYTVVMAGPSPYRPR